MSDERAASLPAYAETLEWIVGRVGLMYLKQIISAFIIVLTVWLAPGAQASIQPRFDCLPVTHAEQCCCARHQCDEGKSCCVSRHQQTSPYDPVVLSSGTQELPAAIVLAKQPAHFKRFHNDRAVSVATGLPRQEAFANAVKLYIWKRSLLI